jgi:imidazole glycerol-phosphate synthase subunit HisF
MLKKRIIPCLDVRNGQTVKGINFNGMAYAGNAVELAALYSKQGADELVLLDITATTQQRGTTINLVKRVAQQVRIPFTVGGGITSVTDAGALLQAGADKITINSAAVKTPGLITSIAKHFGEQCVVVAIDSKLVNNKDVVFIHGGKTITKKQTVAWCKQVENRGAGEILLTSIDNDGVKKGYALYLLDEVQKNISIPLVASGGAGNANHFYELFSQTKINAALAASIFHFGELPIPQLKKYLYKKNIAIRL